MRSLGTRECHVLLCTFASVCFGLRSTYISFLPMIPAFVFGWPTVKEADDFLALDLGVSSKLAHFS
jgi:hypothetical protein